MPQATREAADYGRDDSPRETRSHSRQVNGMLEEMERLERNDQSLRHDLSMMKRRLNDAQRETQNMKTKLAAEQTRTAKFEEQARAFKKLISANSEVSGLVSDDVITGKFEQIFYGMQDFVVSTFPGVKFDYEQLPDRLKHNIRQFLPTARTLPKSQWLNVATSIIAQVMLSYFEPGNHFGESEDGNFEAASLLASDAFGVHNASGQTASVPENRKWLVETRKLLAAYDADALQQADKSLTCEMVESAHNNLCDAMDVVWQKDSVVTLLKVFTDAQELHRLLLAQQAEYIVEMRPAMVNGKAVTFEISSMKDVTGMGDDSDLADNGLVLSMFPAIYKIDHSQAKTLDKAVVVAKARVVTSKTQS
ncbi:uncharacterized protein LTR77_000496 [Saxophila tyrrhenica]|uniref:Uncharacterized protein n=1 Tax=Saxophila tyrrhenica TaxID=1690608 RepID=A0AAV9PR04_9PEZI|nr:hypothetical protein LTR77_000496 [Saxophila tyrrhenica]